MSDAETGGDPDGAQAAAVDAAETSGETAAEAGDDDTAESGDRVVEEGDAVPEIELALYHAEVAVRGRAGDDLADVESTARELMDHLADLAQDLEDQPTDIGLG